VAKPDEAFGMMVSNLEKSTGRSIDEWTAIVNGMGLDKHGQIVSRLQEDYGLGFGYAGMIAHIARGYGTQSSDELLDGVFSGAKAGLRPMYEQLAAIVSALGDDVQVAPKKTMVSFRRSKQFGFFNPVSAKRVVVGIALKGVPPTDRLRASKGMTSHEVELTRPDDVDDELAGWLREAYERS
jgi:hypothetical protein